MQKEQDMNHEKKMKELIEFTKNQSSNEPYGCAIYDESGRMLIATTGNKLSPLLIMQKYWQ